MDEHRDDAEEPDDERELNPTPVLAAFVVVAVIAVLGWLFLRPDNSGELVRPDRLEEVDDDTVRAVAFDRPACEEVLRAQVEMADEAVFVELVVDELEDRSCGDQVSTIQAEIDLPEAIGDRPLRSGVGRFPIPCVDGGASVRCTPDR